jgi:S1-C subfamily serine protease
VRRLGTFLTGSVLAAASVVALLSVGSPDVADPAPPEDAAPPAVEVLGATEVRVPVVLVTASGCGGRSRGSGVLLDDGRVLTARHVLDGASRATVAIDGVEADATVVAVDGDGRDAALLDAPALAGRTGAAVAGDDGPVARTPIRVLGHPYARALEEHVGTLAGVLEDGPLSLDGGPVLALDAVVTEGMSGGPVVDAAGSVVGVAIGYEYNSRTGIAVPIDDLRALLDGEGREVPPDAAC